MIGSGTEGGQSQSLSGVASSPRAGEQDAERDGDDREDRAGRAYRRAAWIVSDIVCCGSSQSSSIAPDGNAARAMKTTSPAPEVIPLATATAATVSM